MFETILSETVFGPFPTFLGLKARAPNFRNFSSLFFNKKTWTSQTYFRANFVLQKCGSNILIFWEKGCYSLHVSESKDTAKKIVTKTLPNFRVNFLA